MNSGIIDVHHHIIPKEYLEYLANAGITSSLGIKFPDWDLNKAIDVMDTNGIAKAIVSISAPGVYLKQVDNAITIAKDLARITNDICAGLITSHPHRFGAFATLPLPDVEAALSELEYALDELKLDGVILLSNYDGRYLGDPYFDVLMSELNRRKAVVFIHPDNPPGLDFKYFKFPAAMVDVCADTTRTAYSLILNGVIEKYPDIQFILAHAGGTTPYLAARVEYVLVAIPALKTQLHNELTYYLRKFYYDTALSASPHTFATLMELIDTSHILFGSDYIFAPPEVTSLEVKGVEEYDHLNKKDLHAIENKNALELFHLTVKNIRECTHFDEKAVKAIQKENALGLFHRIRNLK